MVFRNLCILFLWTIVASTLEGSFLLQMHPIKQIKLPDFELNRLKHVNGGELLAAL